MSRPERLSRQGAEHIEQTFRQSLHSVLHRQVFNCYFGMVAEVLRVAFIPIDRRSVRGKAVDDKIITDRLDRQANNPDDSPVGPKMLDCSSPPYFLSGMSPILLFVDAERRGSSKIDRSGLCRMMQMLMRGSGMLP